MPLLIIIDIEVSGAPVHGTNWTQLEEGQSNCNITVEKYIVEIFPV